MGWHARGTLRGATRLPATGDGYVIPHPWRERESAFGTSDLIGALVRAARNVERTRPGSLAIIGDVSHKTGGGSREHRSHQSGRDVDVFFYSTGARGVPVPPTATPVHFDRQGKAIRWSPPSGTTAPRESVPERSFDTARNWAFVRALLMDPGVEVQWIFVQRDLTNLLLEEGAREGDSPALLARAAVVLRQPSDSEPHDDHMHIRVYCGTSEREQGCADRGPLRWWKKGWKRMQVPFERTEVMSADLSAARALLRSRLPLPLAGVGRTS